MFGDKGAMTEEEIADLLTGIVRVQAAIITGLARNHPHSAENIVRQVRAQLNVGGVASPRGLCDLAARLLLEVLDQPSRDGQPKHDGREQKSARILSRVRNATAGGGG